MCGRFAQPRSSEDLARIFAARAAADLPGGRYNVAPTDEVSAVVERDGERTVDAFRWGLVPHWAHDARGAARRINARAETVESLSAYRAAFRTHRSIIPADAFYEWLRVPDAAAPRSRPLPFAISRTDGAPLALAGLWASWRDPQTAERLRTVTVLTTTPNQLVARVHNRMPVILEPGAWDAWLAEDTSPIELHALLSPLPAERLRMQAVSSAVNDVRNDGPELLVPLAG